MAKVADLAVEVGADIRPLMRGLDRAGGRVDRYQREVSRANKKIVTAFKLVGLATVAVAGSLAALSKRAMATAEELSDVSNKANTTVRSLQELRFAATQNGAASRDMDDALTRLTRRMSLFVADGGGPAAAALEALKISITDTSGNLRDSGDVFREVAARFEAMESGARKAALASQLFGEDAGPRLLPLLNQGISGLDEFARRADDLGLVLETSAVDKAGRANAAFRALGESLRTQVTAAALEGADAFITLANFATEFAVPAFAGVVRIVAEFVQETIRLAQAVGEVLSLGGRATTGSQGRAERRNRRGTAETTNPLSGIFSGGETYGGGNRKERRDARSGTLPTVETVEESPPVVPDVPDQESFEDLLARIEEQQAQITATGRSAEAERTKIAKEAARERERVAEEEAKNREQATSDFWNNMATLGRSGSNKLFQAAKIAAIGRALLELRETVVFAYKHGTAIAGPALGAAYAATAAAAQAANIAGIRSSSPSGGGGGGGASSAAAQVVPNYAFTVQQNIQGDYFTPDQVAQSNRSTLETLAEEVRRRGGSMDVLFP